MPESCAFLTHPLLVACGVEHGFGTRHANEPPGLRRPHQVHGTEVLREDEQGDGDAMVSTAEGVAVGVVTADCVPVLIAEQNGRAVAVAHAGWRGTAGGVVARTVGEVVRRLANTGDVSRLRAVVGPHIGACCYEVDEPVITALGERPGGIPSGALRAVRPGHWMLDLGLVARCDLMEAGIPPQWVGRFPGACTQCDATRFHSYRRDGPRSGRLVHFAAARGLSNGS